MESGDDKQLEQELVDVLGSWTFDFKPSMALIEKSENDVVVVFIRLSTRILFSFLFAQATTIHSTVQSP